MGRSFAKVLDDLALEEPLVDCFQCKVQKPLKRSWEPGVRKCCNFQPFWSLFQIAEYIGQGHELPHLPESTVYLPVGIVPGVRGERIRESHQGKGCSYWSDAKRGCQIYNFRPGECRRYYCASQSQRQDRHREEVFLWAHQTERRAMYLYLVEQGSFTIQDWSAWEAFLDLEGHQKTTPLTAFASVANAKDFYGRARQWWESFGDKVEVPEFSVLLEDL